MAKKKSAKKKKPQPSLLGLRNPQLVRLSPDGLPPEPSRVTPEQREKILERLEAGEKQAPIADEYGVTRQYISLIWKRYKEIGLAAALGHERRGRPKAEPLTPAEQTQIRPVWQNKKPADFGLEPADVWTLNSAKEAARRTIGRAPVANEVAALLKRWKIPHRRHMAHAPSSTEAPWDREVDLKNLDPELRKDKSFLAYLKSPEAKALRERERQLYEELAAKGKLVPKAKIGRPRKVQDSQDAGEESDDDDFDMDLDSLDLAKLPWKTPSRQLRPDPRFSHGQRSGKHSKASQPPKKKKRKRR